MYVAEYFQQGQCFPGQTGSMQIQPNFWHWFHQNYVPMMNDVTWCILLVAMIVWKSDTILVSIKQLSFTEIGRRHLHECTQQHGRVQWWMPPSVQNHKKLVRDLYNKHTNDMELDWGDGQVSQEWLTIGRVLESIGNIPSEPWKWNQRTDQEYFSLRMTELVSIYIF